MTSAQVGPLRLGPLHGIALAGSGVAFPSDLERRDLPGRLDNNDVYRLLLGEGWRESLAAAGHDPLHPERAFGIREREWSAVPGKRPGASASAIDLAALAARRALDDAGLRAAQLDAIVAATSTPSHISSSFAAKIGAALGAPAAAIDLRAGGAGGLFAWVNAATLIAAGARRVLVVAADTPSHYIDPRHLSQALVYGDGGGALVLTADANAGGLAVAELGRRDLPGRPFTIDGNLPPDAGAGRYFFSAPDAAYVEALHYQWSRAGERLAELGLAHGSPIEAVCPYSVTRSQLETLGAAMGSPVPTLHNDLLHHACLGAAGTLVNLHIARSAGALAGGQGLGLVAVAGGASVGLALWT